MTSMFHVDKDYNEEEYDGVGVESDDDDDDDNNKNNDHDDDDDDDGIKTAE